MRTHEFTVKSIKEHIAAHNDLQKKGKMIFEGICEANADLLPYLKYVFPCCHVTCHYRRIKFFDGLIEICFYYHDDSSVDIWFPVPLKLFTFNNKYEVKKFWYTYSLNDNELKDVNKKDVIKKLNEKLAIEKKLFKRK